MESNQQYTKLLIDDLVENDTFYKEEILKLVHEITESCNHEQECIKKQIETPDINTSKRMESIYFKTREKKGCVKGCDSTLDEQLMNIKNTKPQIVVFEITGLTIPKWLLDIKIIPNDYKVVVSYSMVRIDNLIHRNKLRVYESFQKFIKDTQNEPAPRLPDHSKAFNRLVKIKTQLIELYKQCIIYKKSEICGGKQIDRLLIFDNNKIFKLIFDNQKVHNMNLEDFTKIVTKSIQSPSFRKTKRKSLKIKKSIGNRKPKKNKTP
jgi:hypothetical protein